MRPDSGRAPGVGGFVVGGKKRFSLRAGSLFSTFGRPERCRKGGFMLEGLPEAFFGGPRAPQEPPGAPQEPPREPQEPPQRGPRAAKTAPRAPQEPPRRRQEAPGAAKRPSRSLQEPFWLDFGASGHHFRRFWGGCSKHFWPHVGGRLLLLLRSSSSSFSFAGVGICWL